MCEEGAVKKMQGPINSAVQMPPAPLHRGSNLVLIRTQEKPERNQLLRGAAEGRAGYLAHVLPLLIPDVSLAQTPPSNLSLGLTALED